MKKIITYDKRHPVQYINDKSEQRVIFDEIHDLPSNVDTSHDKNKSSKKKKKTSKLRHGPFPRTITATEMRQQMHKNMENTENTVRRQTKKTSSWLHDNPSILDVDLSNKDEKRLITKAAEGYCYLVNAFPTEQEARKATINSLVKILRWRSDEKIQYSTRDDISKLVSISAYLYGLPLIPFQFLKTVNDRRTTCHRAVGEFLNHHEFPEVAFNEDKTWDNDIWGYEKKKYYDLCQGSRFSRYNFERKGALLQNEVIGLCIKHVMRNFHAGSPRLATVPDPLPCPLIALIFTQLSYRLAKRSDHPKAKNAGRVFAHDSNWSELYMRILKNNDPQNQIDWSEVQRIQREVVISGEVAIHDKDSLADLL